MANVKLSPVCNDAQFNNGVPLAGGWITVKYAGTAVDATVYTDSLGSVIGTNPVILNVRGEPTNDIWISTGDTYDFYIYDALGNLLRVIENVTGINDTSTLAFDEWVLYAGTATYVSGTSFSVLGDARSTFTGQRRVRATVTGVNVYGSVLSSSFGAGITTVQLFVDEFNVLDLTLSDVYVGFQDPSINSTAYLSPSDSPMIGFKNKIINGDFMIWDYATIQTSNGYGSDNHWYNSNSGTTKVHSRLYIPPTSSILQGQSTYCSRTAVTSSAGAANFCVKEQRIESVLTLNNKTVTLSFIAKADAAKPIAISYTQFFGTGGAPSVTNSIHVKKITLSNTFAKYFATFHIDSVGGATLGTDNNDYLAITFWFDAGSNYNLRSGTLGQQSGTFDLLNILLEEGVNATSFDRRPISIEEQLCARYAPIFSSVGDSFAGLITAVTTRAYIAVPFLVPARVIPTGIDYNTVGNYTVASTIGKTCTALNLAHSGIRSAVLFADYAGGLTAGFGAVLQIDAPDRLIFTGCEL